MGLSSLTFEILDASLLKERGSLRPKSRPYYKETGENRLYAQDDLFDQKYIGLLVIQINFYCAAVMFRFSNEKGINFFL